MPATVAVLQAIEQQIVEATAGSKWKHMARRPDGAPGTLRAFVMAKGSPDKARVRLEFGGGAVTYGHPLLTQAMTEHYQGHSALFRLTGRTSVRYRFYDDQAKQEIWLFSDPGIYQFDEQAWLDGLVLQQDGEQWVYRNQAGQIVGRIPPVVVRAINAEAGTLESRTAALAVLPQEDGSYILRIIVDQAWLQERFAAGDVVVIDPTTITTSTNSGATKFPNQRKIARFSGGVLFAMFHDGTNMVCRYSSDNGSTWQTPSSGDTIGAYNNGSIWIDEDDYLHFVGVRLGSLDYIEYKRGTPDANRTSYTWSAAKGLVSSATDEEYDCPDITAHAEGTGWRAHAVWSFTSTTSAQVYYQSVTIASDGTITVNNDRTTILSVASGPHRTHPSIHKDSSKNLYVPASMGVTGSGKGTRLAKGTYNSGSWTWSSEAVDENSYAVEGRITSAIDSTGRVIIAYDNAAATNIKVWSRSTGGSYTDISPGLDVTTSSISFAQSDDPYLFYIDGGNPGSLYYRKYDRDASTWGSATQIDTATNIDWPSARYGSAGSAIDVLYTQGGASPYNVKTERVTVNRAPNEPTLSASPTAFDAADGADITITHNDPDGDNMSAYALKRVVGATTDYWNATTKAWQSTEVFNSATGTSVTIPKADNAGDWTNNTTYHLYARTRDAESLTGPYNSTGLQVKASQKPTVTIDSPAAGGTVSASQVTVQWTTSDPEGQGQSKYKVRLLDASDNQLETTGEVSDANARSRTMSTVLTNNTTYKVEVTVWDGDGVPSTAVTHSFTTSFTAPLAATDVTTEDDAASARIRVKWPRGQRILATFSRSSVAYNPDNGVEVSSGTPRYGAPRNILTANQSDVETDASGFTAQASATLSRTTDYAWQGSSSLKVVTPGTQQQEGFYVAPNTTAGNTYTFSVWLRGSGTVRLRITGGSTGNALATGSSITLTDSWTRHTLTATAESGSTFTRFFVHTIDSVQATTFYADGLQVEQSASATPWHRGGDRSGLFTEETTTNILTANQSNVETDTTGFAAFGDGTLSRVTTDKWEGTASLEVDYAGGGIGYGGVYTTGRSASAGTATGSVYLKSVSGSTTAKLRLWDVTNSQATTITITLTTDWKRFTVSHTLGAASTNLRLYVYIETDAGTFRFDGAQIEERAYATSWHLGGGTRAAESSYADHVALPSDWMAVIEVIPDWDSTVNRSGEYAAIWECWLDNNNLIRLRYFPGNDKFEAIFTSGGSTVATLTSTAKTFSKGDILRFVVAGLSTASGDVAAGKHVWIKIGTGTTEHLSSTDTTSIAATRTYFGTFSSTGQEGNLTTARFLILHRAPADEAEVENYLGGTVSVQWEQETALLSQFPADLEAGNQNASFGTTWRLERRKSGGSSWDSLGTVNNPSSGLTVTHDDYSPGSGITYEYRVVAIGNNTTEKAGDAVSDTVTFENPRFIPTSSSEQSKALRFPYNWRFSWRPEEDVNVPPTRSKYRPVYTGPTFPVLVDIEGHFVSYDGLSAREWKERILDLVERRVEGWLKTPTGDVYRGIIMAPGGDLATSPLAQERIRLQFRELKKAV